jgi:predicted phage terminase large subunit-like protein
MRQAQFLALEDQEAFYGGAAGGGKSHALYMAALQFIEVPGYAAILFRRSYTDLALPGALMERAQQYLGGTEAKWSDRAKTWTFPSGATLSFGYMETETDKFRYQSSAYQYCAFDEVTHFTESQYRYLFSRLRRLVTADGVPIRMRSASNPGGIGHEWVKQRFITEGPKAGRAFISAKLKDNPHLDQAAYVQSLSRLDPITRAQLLNGDWSARSGASMFRREWFEVVSDVPAGMHLCRYWDLAGTEAKAGMDPDWVVGLLAGEEGGRMYVCDVQRIRAIPSRVESLVKSTAVRDGVNVAIAMEQEPGSSGKALIDHYQRTVLPGFTFHGRPSTGNKALRASPVASAAEAGNVKLLVGAWIGSFLDELEAFPGGAHDDQVDALSGVHQEIFIEGRMQIFAPAEGKNPEAMQDTTAEATEENQWTDVFMSREG